MKERERERQIHRDIYIVKETEREREIYKQAQRRAAAETAARQLREHFKRSMYGYATSIIIVRYD